MWDFKCNIVVFADHKWSIKQIKTLAYHTLTHIHTLFVIAPSYSRLFPFGNTSIIFMFYCYFAVLCLAGCEMRTHCVIALLLNNYDQFEVCRFFFSRSFVRSIYSCSIHNFCIQTNVYDVIFFDIVLWFVSTILSFFFSCIRFVLYFDSFQI